MIVFYIIGVLLLTLIIVLVVRAIMFKPVKQDIIKDKEVSFDKEAAIYALSELVKCKTVSDVDHTKEDDKEFEKLINKLPKLYPLVMKELDLQKFDGRGLLFHWKGENKGDPAVFMAHYDVVPVEEEYWTHPAFAAEIIDGIMWGRGTLDTKVTFNGVMFAAETLLSQGFKPQRDIYFAFSGGEEVNGIGASEIVRYFKKEGITPAFVLDEGGAVVDNIFPGVKESCGLIGIAEKGLMNVEFKVNSKGGHASAPAPHTPVGILSKACANVESHPFKKHFTLPVLAMFDVLGRRSSFIYRIIFANLWLFGGVLDIICKKSGGELNAMIRTTCAYTMMSGSKAYNVVPPAATMVANLRLNPEDNINLILNQLEKTINDKDVEISLINGNDPSPISRIDVEGYKIISSAVSNTWNCITSPYLMVQCSDSRHYGEISDRVYRFSACDLLPDERHSIHGNDEHIRLETINKSVEFFIRVMNKC